MKLQTPRHGQSLSWIIIAYYIAVGLLIYGAFFPDGRVWGFNWWHFVPPLMQVLLGVVGLIAPILLRAVATRLKTAESLPIHVSSARFWLTSGAGLAMMALLFWVGRNRTHFLGDGYQILANVEQYSSTHMIWNYAIEFIQGAAYELLGGTGQATALLSLQLLSIAAGVGALILALWCGRRLGLGIVDSWLLALLVCLSGAGFLFFGYVETYPLFITAVISFCLLGLLAATGKVAWPWVALPLGIAIALHAFAVVLMPSILYLGLRTTSFGKRVRAIPKIGRIFGSIMLGLTGALVLILVARTNYVMRFWFVPLMADQFTLEGYTLFSISHLLDVVNLQLLLAPATPIMVVVLSQIRAKNIARNPQYLFLLIAAAFSGVLAFIIDPKLGMPRDWDLFAFAATPMVIAPYALVGDRELSWSRRTTVVALALLLEFLVLCPRVTTFASTEQSIQVIKSYGRLDHAKSRNLQILLGTQLEAWGRKVDATEVRRSLMEQYPEIERYERSTQALNQGQFAASIVLAQQAITYNPTYYSAYSNLGACYLSLGRLDDALEAYRTCYYFNSRNARILYNMANVYARKGNTVEARRWIQQSLQIDSAFAPAIMASIIIAIAEKRPDEIPGWIQRLETAHGVDLAYTGFLLTTLVRGNRYAEAAQIIAIARRNGMDSTAVAQYLNDYPNLSRYLR